MGFIYFTYKKYNARVKVSKNVEGVANILNPIAKNCSLKLYDLNKRCNLFPIQQFLTVFSELWQKMTFCFIFFVDLLY